jgi:hypothetical protein
VQLPSLSHTCCWTWNACRDHHDDDHHHHHKHHKRDKRAADDSDDDHGGSHKRAKGEIEQISKAHYMIKNAPFTKWLRKKKVRSNANTQAAVSQCHMLLPPHALEWTSVFDLMAAVIVASMQTGLTPQQPCGHTLASHGAARKPLADAVE